MVELIHKAQITVTQFAQLFLAQTAQILIHQYYLAFRRHIQATKKVQQRRFTTA